MATRIALSIGIALTIACSVLADSKPQPLPPMNAGKWRADVEFFARELPQRHKNAFHAITREQFGREIATLNEKAAHANDDEMIVGFMQLIARIGDGHTYLHLPSSTRQFPLTVVSIEGSPRVVRGAGAAAELVGGTLARIDDTPIDKAVAQIHTILPQDESDILLAGFTPQWLPIAEVLHGLGITKSADNARFTVVMDDGTERSAGVDSISVAATPTWRTATTTPPLYRQHLGESFWYVWLPESSTVYVNFRKYTDLHSKSKELWAFVDAHPARKIVIDLRQNGGGDFNVGRKYLVDEVAKRSSLRPYVITSATTFSAAMKNAIDFRNVAHATLAGETIGEKPNSYSENDEFTLPGSRMQVSYSTQYYEFLPGGGLVTPDKEIHQTWADWLAGRDPVLDWILKQ